MFSNLDYVQQLVSLLKAHKITKFVVSPGSRHIPIVISMENDPEFQLYSVVDERSASFFAIGLIHKFKEPVGIICTSGTACANYTSAIAEAYYQELPLLVITADRLPCFLNQLEDQTIPQPELFRAITKLVVSLPTGSTSNDRWFANRLINEALLELHHQGCGPVQINVPIESHVDKFECEKLPKERVISRYTMSDNDEFWEEKSSYLKGKKILIIVGEGNPFTKFELESINSFCQHYDAAILSDKMSNCHAEYAVNTAFCVLHAISPKDLPDLSPDIVIFIRANYSFNPESKGFIQRCGCKESWFVSPTGAVKDPFRNLTEIYEMDEFMFFSKLSRPSITNKIENKYGEIWKNFESTIEIPEFEYGQLKAITRLMQNLPENCTLNLANSQAVRIAQLVNISPSIEVHGNRGTDGIDGCMSSYVGLASNSQKLAFLIIGDLSFFYDMNALWNNYIGNNLRILLCNNFGGSIMHMPKRPPRATQLLPNYISAGKGPKISAKAWALDREFRYLSVHDNEELDIALDKFLIQDSDRPIIMEVFSDMYKDVEILKEFYSGLHPYVPTLRERISAHVPDSIKNVAKMVLRSK